MFLREVIRDGENGYLVDFFDTKVIADKVVSVLGDMRRLTDLRKQARKSIVAGYDLTSLSLPRQVQMVERLLAGRPNAGQLNAKVSDALVALPTLPRYPGLTARESEVLAWLNRGKNAWEVAQILGRSEHTVKNQVRSIYSKLGVKNRVEVLQRTNEFTRAD